MTQRFIHHLRANVIAYVALFVALGGTSYAAVSLPKNSVGTTQLRNGAVTPAKLGSGAGGEVFAVTQLNAAGGVISSTPKNVKVKDWQTNGSPPVVIGGLVYYPMRIPNNCLPIATAEGSFNSVDPSQLPGATAERAGRTGIQIAADSSTALTVAIVCPR